MKKLNPDIVVELSKKIDKEESTIQKDIYSLRKSYPTCTINAVAQIYAQTYGHTVYRKLDKDDKQSLPNLHVEKQIIVKKKSTPKKRIEKLKIFIEYQTVDSLRKGHIQEINKAYTAKCYTCVFILIRKIIENMLIDILRYKFPPTSKDNKELYFDTNLNRFKDFSIVLKNFRAKSHEFGMEKKLVERIADVSKQFKDEGNDKAHSWFHLVTSKPEMDDLKPQFLIDLISKLEKNIGISANGV